MALDIIAIAIAKKYVDESLEGVGAIAGKPCQIQKKEAITGGTRVTFLWVDNSDVEHTTTMDVMNGVDGQDGQDGQDGEDGKGIKSVAVNAESHLIITYTDDTTSDAGAIEVHAAVDSVNGKTGEVTLDASDVGALPDDTPLFSGDFDDLSNKPTLGSAAALDVPESGNASSSEVVKGNDTRLTDARTPTSHTHTVSEISDFPTLGTAAGLDVPVSGNASTSEVVKGDDSRLSDARTPTSHSHTVSEISDLDLTDYVQKSSTAGLLKNDGTVDETTYATASSVNGILDGQSIDSFADVETALSGKADTGDIPDITGKADKVTNGTENNFAALDANGNLKDSGKKASDFIQNDLNIIIPKNAGSRNSIYRGASLGSSITADQLAAIAAGTFDGMFIGDYWEINSKTYRIADFDYWLHTGDTECTDHHVVVVPDENFPNQPMNATDITTGGYAGSKMHTENLATAKTAIQTAFGAAHILTHRELFTKTVTDGKSSGWDWYDSDVDLMNECMVYGHNAWGSAPQYETGIDKDQLALFRLNSGHITNRASWWLRDVVSASHFALVNNSGHAGCPGAGSAAIGVRPAFAIK